jgi:hypothetical protein
VSRPRWHIACSSERMAKTNNLDDEKAQPLGDTGDGDAGVPADEQGISNRPGDAEVGDAAEQFDDDEDEDDDDVEDDKNDDTAVNG